MQNQPSSDNTVYWILSGVSLLISGLQWLPELIKQVAEARKYKYETLKKESTLLSDKVERLEKSQMMIDAILIHSKPFIMRDVKDPEVVALFESLENINNTVNVTSAGT